MMLDNKSEQKWPLAAWDHGTAVKGHFFLSLLGEAPRLRRGFLLSGRGRAGQADHTMKYARQKITPRIASGGAGSQWMLMIYRKYTRGSSGRSAGSTDWA